MVLLVQCMVERVYVLIPHCEAVVKLRNHTQTKFGYGSVQPADLGLRGFDSPVAVLQTHPLALSCLVCANKHPRRQSP